MAIAAPYEAGNGRVYIYMGSPRGVRGGDLPVQSVAASNTAVRGMGFSMAARTDVDGNGFDGKCCLLSVSRIVCCVLQVLVWSSTMVHESNTNAGLYGGIRAWL